MTENNTNLPEEIKSGAIQQAQEEILGFEEADQNDMIVPRIKVVQALSPERKDKIADEGDIINALSQEKIEKTDVFVPIKVYYSNIEWNPDRGDDLRMFCRSLDGRIGVDSDGNTLACATCRRNQFDNTKTGKEAQPSCTAYMNFLGFFEGNPMPVVLSFAKTNYNEGKKMLSIAKSLMKSIWSYGYTIDSKEITKNGNSWYIMVPHLAGETSQETRMLATQLFKAFEKASFNVDYENTAAPMQETNSDVEAEI